MYVGTASNPPGAKPLLAALERVEMVLQSIAASRHSAIHLACKFVRAFTTATSTLSCPTPLSVIKDIPQNHDYDVSIPSRYSTSQSRISAGTGTGTADTDTDTDTDTPVITYSRSELTAAVQESFDLALVAGTSTSKSKFLMLLMLLMLFSILFTVG